MKSFKLLRRYLLESEFQIDGNTYKFLEVSLVENSPVPNYIKVLVNVKLPKKGQSYYSLKFTHDIEEILESLSSHVGKISVSIETLLDGEPHFDIFISRDKKNEIMNFFVNKFSGKNELLKFEDETLYAEIKPRFFPNSRNFYKGDLNEIQMNFVLDFYNFYINRERKSIRPEYLNNFATTLNDTLIDSDNLRSTLEEGIMQILEDELYIADTNIYYSINFWVGTLDGMEWNSRSYLNRPQIFSQVFY